MLLSPCCDLILILSLLSLYAHTEELRAHDEGVFFFLIVLFGVFLDVFLSSGVRTDTHMP